MNQEIKDRVLLLSSYIYESKDTIRGAAEKFLVSKSTVHIDLSKRLKKVDKKLYEKVKKILENNFKEKHIRGGNATRKKYLSKNISLQGNMGEINNLKNIK